MEAETLAPRIVISMWVMIVVSLVFIGLRYFSRRRYGTHLGWDDFILLSSWICLLLYTTFTTAACEYGVGKHAADIPADDLPKGMKLFYIGLFFAIGGVALSKTSFAVTLLRLAQHPWHTYFLWVSIATINISMWLCGVLMFAQCTPVEKLWNLQTEGTCWDPRIQIDFATFAGAYSAFMDVALAIVPWILVWGLQMRTAEKIGVALAMSLGVLAGVTGAIKTSYLPDAIRWADFTYSCADFTIWAASEIAVTIIAASIPFLRLAFLEVKQKTRATGYYSRTNATTMTTTTAKRQSHRISRCVVIEAAPAPMGRGHDRSDRRILGEIRELEGRWAGGAGAENRMSGMSNRMSRIGGMSGLGGLNGIGGIGGVGGGAGERQGWGEDEGGGGRESDGGGGGGVGGRAEGRGRVRFSGILQTSEVCVEITEADSEKDGDYEQEGLRGMV